MKKKTADENKSNIGNIGEMLSSFDNIYSFKDGLAQVKKELRKNY